MSLCVLGAGLVGTYLGAAAGAAAAMRRRSDAWRVVRLEITAQDQGARMIWLTQRQIVLRTCAIAAALVDDALG